MRIEVGEYHPYTACMMYETCRHAGTVRENLKAVIEHGKRLQAQVPSEQITVMRSQAERENEKLRETIRSVNVYLQGYRIIPMNDFYNAIPKMIELTDIE